VLLRCVDRRSRTYRLQARSSPSSTLKIVQELFIRSYASRKIVRVSCVPRFSECVSRSYREILVHRDWAQHVRKTQHACEDVMSSDGNCSFPSWRKDLFSFPLPLPYNNRIRIRITYTDRSNVETVAIFPIALRIRTDKNIHIGCNSSITTRGPIVASHDSLVKIQKCLKFKGS